MSEQFGVDLFFLVLGALSALAAILGISCANR